MKSRARVATVGARYLVPRRPHDGAVTPGSRSEPELAEAAAALTRWRDTRPLGGRIPEALWSRAVELASRHGVAKVARACGWTTCG